VEVARYTKVAIAFHWAIAVLILLNFPLGLWHEQIEDLGIRAMPVHKSIGLTVLFLSVLRLGWRLTFRPPPLSAEIAPWQRTTSGAAHSLLYLLMVSVPFTGWLRSSASSYPLIWFGALDIPRLPLMQDSAEAAVFSVAHVVLAWLLILLAAIHISAALYHHLVLRDQVMQRMLPGG
jgi:cytochrome b561